MSRSWEDTQIKVFSRWSNKYLQARGMSLENCTTDFSDGVKLINLLEEVGKEPIGGKYHKAPKMRIQMLENCDIAIKYITQTKKVRLVGIGSNDIVDKNVKLTLGLIWSVINKFLIEDITVEEATARDALLIWCKKNTAGYSDVSITDFGSSWSSGLGFCALINRFRPDVLDYNSLNKSDHTDNCIQAFEACKKLGITVYLDPEDLVGIRPDEKSVVTQVSEFFHFFASDIKTEQMAEKLKRTIAIQRSISDLQNNYEEEARRALAAMEHHSEQIADTNHGQDVSGLKSKLVEVIKYGKEGRPEVFELKAKAQRSWNALQLKCKSHKRPVPQPAEGLDMKSLNARFEKLDEEVLERRKGLLSELKSKVEAYIQHAKNIQEDFAQIDSFLASIEGENEEKRSIILKKIDEINEKKESASTLGPQYDELEAAELHLEIIETPSFIQSLISNTLTNAQGILREIDSAIASAKGLEVSQEQMEEFRETFDIFDKDKSRSLQYYELKACLTALGEDVSDEQAKDICKTYNNGQEELSFDAYVTFMLDRFSKAENPQTTKDAFLAIAANGPVVTDEQLIRYFSPEDVKYLQSTLPKADGGYDYSSWVDIIFK